MNNEENNKELDPRPTDKEKQAYSNEVNRKDSTFNEKNQPLTKTSLQNQSLNRNYRRQFNKPTQEKKQTQMGAEKEQMKKWNQRLNQQTKKSKRIQMKKKQHN